MEQVNLGILHCGVLELFGGGEDPVGLNPTLKGSGGLPWSFSAFSVLTLQAGSKAFVKVFPVRFECSSCKLVDNRSETDIQLCTAYLLTFIAVNAAEEK